MLTLRRNTLKIGAMKFLPELFENNRQWAARQLADDPAYFGRLAGIQRPDYLWIGCSDSRVPANTIVGLAPGEVFVQRNVSNIVHADDRNCMSVIQYAVDVLKVSHIIVCGHYHCGGVQAAMGPALAEPLESWLGPIRCLCRDHAGTLSRIESADERWDRLCEINVRAQVDTLTQLPIIRAAWSRGQTLTVHGWIYDIKDGLLRDLDVCTSAA
jgi:carbonic anhydrase